MKAWEAAEREKIRSAAYFTVVLLLGSAKYYREEHLTLADARKAREVLPPDPYGRRYMIYAVTAARESIFVKDDFDAD